MQGSEIIMIIIISFTYWINSHLHWPFFIICRICPASASLYY